MLGLGDAISEISFKLTDNARLAETVASLRSAAPDLETQPWTVLSPMAAAIDAFMTEFVYIWLWVMFVFMAIGIVNTQLMAVFERKREFGLLQALGMRPRHILLQVTLESGLMVGVGVLIGMAASALVILMVSGGIDLGALARGAEYVGASRVLYPDLSPVEFVTLSIIVWVLGIAVGLWPAERATRARGRRCHAARQVGASFDARKSKINSRSSPAGACPRSTGSGPSKCRRSMASIST